MLRFILLFLLFTSSTTVWSQNAIDNAREETMERVRALIQTPFESSRLQGLDDIELAVRKKIISNDDAASLLEQALILDSRDTDFRKPSNVSLPSVRIKALTVLAKAPGEASVKLLIWVLSNDRESSVLEEALKAAQILIDTPNSVFLDTLVRILRDNFPNAPNDALMLQAMQTITWFHNNKGGMKTRALFDAIVELSEHPRYLQLVRRNAQTLIRLIMNAR